MVVVTEMAEQKDAHFSLFYVLENLNPPTFVIWVSTIQNQFNLLALLYVNLRVTVVEC